MVLRVRKLAACATLIAALPMVTTAAQAQSSVAKFYKGKTITLVVAFGAGGMYGLNGRIMGKHLGKHIPGRPNVIVQHKSGAGGSKAASYMYSAAPKDGTYISELSKDIAVAKVMRPKKLKYDAAKFNYLGRMMPYSAVFMVWHKLGVKSVADAKRKQVIVANSGKASHSYIEAAALREWTGMKLKLVRGYKGAANMYKAMESGEAHARIGAWFSLKATKPQWLRQRKVHLILQTGLEKAPDLPNVPLLIDFARNAEERKMAELMELGSPVGWGLTAPPGTPRIRVQALRTAFNKMVKSRAFLKEAKARKTMVRPATGQQVQGYVNRTLKVSPRLVAKIRKLAGF
jgi:tripartite-type tricarboxylate transporter receptor subunit TctC